ncbi:hypothetical protein PXO_03154 [Xanthomonas oryzae pv. oryzae PXO99A]|uniref:Uncharacterized protein n=1 Tax=Xanthomonas oryzae pv. oryzae (strain PXO99A) TaxID=360094 RepID=A0A0K0GQ23_XANOP|nr:hypothetical protein PXO_03154 [Xanthomonas oryzae pv. oryzae PXO99A]
MKRTSSTTAQTCHWTGNAALQTKDADGGKPTRRPPPPAAVNLF